MLDQVALMVATLAVLVLLVMLVFLGEEEERRARWRGGKPPRRY